MRIRSRAICGALALAALAPSVAAAQAQPNPFADLFGRAPERSGREFTAVQFRTQVGAQFGQTLESGFDDTEGALQEGLSGGADASLIGAFVRDRVQAQVQGRYSYQEYQRAAFGAPSVDAGGNVNLDLTTRLAVFGGGRFVRSPYYRLEWPARESSATAFVPGDRAAITMLRNDTSEGTAGITSRYTKKSTLSASVFMRETTFADSPGNDFSARGVRGQWKRQMTRDLAIRAGYGREELRQQFTDAADLITNELIDIGVDYTRSLSLARRTTLSFATETSVLRERGGPRKYRINGSLDLQKFLGRSWLFSAGARRATEFLPGFRAPVFTERARLGLGGYLAKRLILQMNADGGQGHVAFFDSRKFISYTGDARLTVALTRHLGLFTQYVYYHSRLPAEPLTLQLDPRLSRQAVSIGVQTWLSLIDKEKVPRDPR